jgi:Domain of unknown function (DUF4407)
MTDYSAGRGERRGSRFGNAMITIAGADSVELDGWSADRAYYIGMGTALLLAATISTVALMEATSICFGVPFDSPALIVGGTVYFLLLYGLDRWLVSDQTTGFAGAGNRPAAVAWFGHLVVEAFKIAPRVFVAFLSSLLFANFLMLAVFNHEIQQQLTLIQVQRSAKFQTQVTALANSDKAQANAIIAQASAANASVAAQFNSEQKARNAAAATEHKELAAASAAGYSCSEEPVYTVARNPNTGIDYDVFDYDEQVCPPQINTITAAYTATVAEYPMTPKDVTDQQQRNDVNYGVVAQERILKNAQSVAQKKMAPYAPQRVDGLLARMQALQLLTTPPTGVCPSPPSVNDLATNAACISQYSEFAASLHLWLRLWLLSLEIMPVGMKFINSLLPRRGYAWAMAARDLEKGKKGRVRIGQVREEEKTDLASFSRREHARLEEEGALLEYKQRELARQERRLGLRRIRARFAGAAADADRPRNRRSWRGNRADPESGQSNVFSLADRVDPRNSQADPGFRVIENEDFLY